MSQVETSDEDSRISIEFVGREEAQRVSNESPSEEAPDEKSNSKLNMSQTGTIDENKANYASRKRFLENPSQTRDSSKESKSIQGLTIGALGGEIELADDETASLKISLSKEPSNPLLQ